MKTTRTGKLILTKDELDWCRQKASAETRHQMQQEFNASNSTQVLQAKQMEQAIALMKEAASMMSKIGYMVGKINQDNSR